MDEIFVWLRSNLKDSSKITLRDNNIAGSIGRRGFLLEKVWGDSDHLLLFHRAGSKSFHEGAAIQFLERYKVEIFGSENLNG